MSDDEANAADIVLASASPRRRELVERLGLVPEVIVAEIPEQIRPEESPTDYTERLAEAKARDVADRLGRDRGRPDLVLAADTIVVYDGEVLEKPADEEEAYRMIGAMSGNWHTVLTSYCWLERRAGRAHVDTVATEVRLRELPEALVRRYVETGEPLDKAGSYGIQDFGSLLVRELRGSYFNVVGLPVCEAVEMLETLGAFETHPLLREGDRGAIERGASSDS